jgi:hypothetical protein
MKPIMPFKWKAQRRVPWTLLLGVLALWAMPRSAHAQLYASQSTTNTVGKYDANTGAAINANFITVLSGPMGLALSADGTVLFVANDSNGSVGEYNAATGAAINANFITEGGGLFGPVLSGIALSGNNLFVELFSPDPSSSSTVIKYDATMGVAINADFITGLNGPALLLAVGPTPTPTAKELVWENTVTGEHSIWVLDNGVPGNVISLPTISVKWNIAATGDFLGTGQPDLVWENIVTGQHSIWILNNGVPTNAISLPTIPIQWHVAAAADFLGTGQADLVWENTVTGPAQYLGHAKRGAPICDQSSDYLYSVAYRSCNRLSRHRPGGSRLGEYSHGPAQYLGHANGVPANVISLPTSPIQWRIAAAADSPDSAQADLVWENTVTGEQTIWILNNGVPFSSIKLPTIFPEWQIVD